MATDSPQGCLGDGERASKIVYDAAVWLPARSQMHRDRPETLHVAEALQKAHQTQTLQTPKGIQRGLLSRLFRLRRPPDASSQLEEGPRDHQEMTGIT